MDYRALWHQVMTELQGSIHHFRVKPTQATHGILHVGYKDDSESHIAEISADSDHGQAEITIRPRHVEPKWAQGQVYRLSPGNANEPPRAMACQPTSDFSDYHLLRIGTGCGRELACAVATWIAEVVVAEHERRKQLSGIDEDALLAEKLERLKGEADKGDADALMEALRIIETGRRVAHHEEWIGSHAGRGNASAQRILGKYYLELCEDEQLDKKGLDLLKLAAEQSCPESAYELSNRYGMYDNDNHEDGDPDGEFLYRYGPAKMCRAEEGRWQRRAAELGHPLARHQIALCNVAEHYVVPEGCERDVAACLEELRALATSGFEPSIVELGGLRRIDERERHAWAAHGAAMGIKKSQLQLAENYRHGRGTAPDGRLALKWLRRAYASSRDPELLLGIGAVHFDAIGHRQGSLFKALDCWNRHAVSSPVRPPFFADTHPHTLGLAVIARNRHLLVNKSGQMHILDTGSPVSPSLDELDGRYPGIKAHIHKEVGADVHGIFGNDQILSGSGFVLDMRRGTEGTLWLVDSVPEWMRKERSEESQGRLPLITVLSSRSNSCHISSGHFVRPLRAYIDTGAQYSYIKAPLAAKSSMSTRDRDFTLAGGQFETFDPKLVRLEVFNSHIIRACDFGNLPAHLSEAVFKELGADAIVGQEFLRDSLLVWRKGDNLCHIQDGIHADMAELFIGTELNAVPVRAPSQFESYFLGLGDHGRESFKDDIRSVVPPDARRESSGGVTSYALSIVALGEGGSSAHIRGHHRSLFMAGCYFKVLIDQVFHHHYRPHHTRFDQLADTVKLTLLAPNISPDHLLNETTRDDPAASAAFVQARTFFEAHIKELVREHFPSLSPEEVWNKVNGYLPTKYPYFS